VTRAPFGRWFGWSVAAHLALGLTVWIGLPRLTPTSLPASDAAVTVVSLVDAPMPEDHPTTPNAHRLRSPLITPLSPPLLQQLPDAPPLENVPMRRRLPPTWRSKGGGGDLPREPLSPQPVDTMDTSDDSFLAPIPDSSLSTPDPAQPEPTAAWINDSPGPQDDANGSLLPSSVSLHVSEVRSSVGASTDHYRPLVLAILERAKRYPLLAQRRGLEGTVEITFMISPDGRLSDPELLGSSTYHVLDEATLAMVRRVGVVPPPPSPTPVRFPARIQYRLDPCPNNPPFEKGGLGGFHACTDEPPAHKN
jgi:TonB family protein